MADPESGAGSWFRSDIASRKHADVYLNSNGCQEGDFIIRPSKGNYVCSVVYNGSPTHHNIQKQEDGLLAINGKSYSKVNTLSKLVKRLGKVRDDWPVALQQASPPETKKTKSPKKAKNDDPFADDGNDPFFDGGMFGDENTPVKSMTSSGKKNAKSPKTKTTDEDDPFGGDDDFNFDDSPKTTPKSEKNKKKKAAKETKEESEPAPSWLSAGISRKEADTQLASSKNGDFLVRRNKENFVLAVVFNNKPTHHRIENDADGKLILNGNKFDNLKDLVSSLSKPLEWWPVMLNNEGNTDAATKQTKQTKSAKELSPEIKSKKKKKEKTMTAEEKEKLAEDAANKQLELAQQLAEAQRQANEDAALSSKKADEKRKKKEAKKEAERAQKQQEAMREDAKKTADEDKAFVQEATEAANQSAKQKRLADEKAAQDERDKQEAASLMDAFDGEPSAKKKNKEKGASLSGWRLKKAQRKALSEAENKSMGYMEYIQQNNPELVEHGVFEAAPKPQPPVAVVPPPNMGPPPTVPTTAPVSSGYPIAAPVPNANPQQQQPPLPPTVKEPTKEETEKEKKKREKKEKKEKKKKEKEEKEKEETEKEKDTGNVKATDKENDAEKVKMKDEPSKKKDQKSKKTAETSPVTPAVEITYPWEAITVSKKQVMNARRNELMGLNFTADPKLMAEFAKLTQVQAQMIDDEPEVKPTPSVDPTPTSTTVPTPPTTTPTPVPEKKKSGGWFGMFGSAPEVEEEVPDHDNDEHGQPLNRIELIRRQNKRVRNAKIRASRKAAGLPDPVPDPPPTTDTTDATTPTVTATATATTTPTTPTTTTTTTTVAEHPPAVDDYAYSTGSLPISTIVEEEEEGGSSSDEEFIMTKVKGAPKEEWVCEFCTFKHTKFDIVNVHERHCTHNPDSLVTPGSSTTSISKSTGGGGKSKGKGKGKGNAKSKTEGSTPEVVMFDSSDSDSSDSDSDSDSEYVKPNSAATKAKAKKDTSKSRHGTSIEVDSDMIKELLKTVSDLSSVTSSLKSEVSSLHQSLAQVKAELSTLKAHVAGNGIDNSVSNIYSWHQHACAEPQMYYQKLSDRKIELQKQAQPGIQDAEEKEAWTKEFGILDGELTSVTQRIAVANDNLNTASAGKSSADASDATQNSFSILAIGGRVGTLDATAYLERFDLDSKTWISLAPMPTERFGIAAGCLLGFVYVVGGSGAPKITSPNVVNAKPTAPGSLNLVERYDIGTNRWEQVAKCSATRAGLAATVLNEHLYVIGGASDALFGSVILNSGEKYNPRDNTWRNICPMNTKRAGLAAAVVDGHLYAIGGYDQNIKCLTTVERYDPQTNGWSEMASMSGPRARLALAVVGFKIYAIGGYNGSTRLNSVECYDVEANAWTTIAPMRFPRDYHAASTIGGTVHAIGGFNGSDRLNTIEAYDAEQNAWVDVPRMKFARDGLCAVGVDLLESGDDSKPTTTSSSATPSSPTTKPTEDRLDTNDADESST